ncbi:hypothetical protein E1176_16380, partial [Fulvivirga sp. RKSG066]|nr:hypothetical protein [Fulvivirga aurantia]
MKYLLALLVLLIYSSAFTQDVILFEDFEGSAPGWYKSKVGTANNEWYVLATNSKFTYGSNSLGVSNDGVNNTYVNGGTGSSAWVSPNWTAGITTQDVEIQFDLRVNGQDLLVAPFMNIDFMSVYLVDVDTTTTLPTPANLTGSNSLLLTERNKVITWSRLTLTLNAAAKTFINNAVNNTLLVFTWENNATVTNQAPAAIDNVIIKTTPTAAPALAGDYHIGKSTGADFATITDAVDYLNSNGQSGNVNFYLLDEEYNHEFEEFPFEIGDGTNSPYPGMGTYNLTIKPDPATNPTPTITEESNYFTGNLDSHGVFTLWGVDNVTIDGSNTVGGTTRDLTVVDAVLGGATDSPMAIFLAGPNETDAMENIVIKNTNLATEDVINGYGLVAGNHNAVLVAGHFADEAVFNNITIQNNRIYKAKEGIHVDGVDRILAGYSSNSYATNIDIIGNDLESTGADALQETGIHVLGVNNGNISQNTVGNFNQVDLNSDAGIIIDQNSRNLVVDRNEVHSLGFNGDNTSSLSAHAMEVYTGISNANITLKNNVIRNISGNGANSTANAGYLNPVAFFLGLGGEVGALQTYTQSGINIYNNSINLFGQEMDFLTSVSMGLAVASNTTGVDFRNNIVKNTLGGDNTLAGQASALAVFAESASSQIDHLNYNVYHIDANTIYTRNYVGLIGTLADILSDADNNMAAWRATTGKDMSTSFADPGYTSDSNLLPNNLSAVSWSVHGMGEPLTSVNNDFNNASRSTAVATGTPDVGAFEFTIDPIAVPPTKVTQAGPLATGVNYLFSIGERLWVDIKFNPGSDLPDDVSVQYFPGVFAASTSEYNIFNKYIDLTATENSNTNYDYDITIYYDEVQIGNVPSENEPTLEVTQNENFAGMWQTRATTVNTASNSLTANNMNTFGRYTATSNSSPLPVEWASFTAYESGEQNKLEWATATEVNSYMFEVERSADGKSWELIGEKSAAGDSRSLTKYSFNDYD